MKYTPAPWSVVDKGTYIQITDEKGAATIATTGCWHEEHHEEMRANGRLIAAAPDLLTAAKQFIRSEEAYASAWFSGAPIIDAVGANRSNAISALRDAVDKAEADL